MFRTTRPAGALALLVMLIAACGPGGGASSAPSNAPSGAPSAAASTEPSAAASGSSGYTYSIGMTDDATLGPYLVDAEGKTLYIFTSDSPDTSTCAGGCAESWPPLVVEAGATVGGADGVSGTFGTITRDDGTLQVTYDQRPLYYYAGDAAAGDTNGQEMGGVWFVAAVSGESTSASESPGRGDY